MQKTKKKEAQQSFSHFFIRCVLCAWMRKFQLSVECGCKHEHEREYYLNFIEHRGRESPKHTSKSLWKLENSHAHKKRTKEKELNFETPNHLDQLTSWKKNTFLCRPSIHGIFMYECPILIKLILKRRKT